MRCRSPACGDELSSRSSEPRSRPPSRRSRDRVGATLIGCRLTNRPLFVRERANSLSGDLPFRARLLYFTSGPKFNQTTALRAFSYEFAAEV